MNRVGQFLAWCLNRLTKSFGNIPSVFLRLFYPVRKGTIVCWSYDFKQYSCNPRYLTEYILDNYPDMEIYWIFRGNPDLKDVDSRIKCIKFHTWEYYKIINTAEFLVTNCRTDAFRFYWIKRPAQKYLMLWHGGIALKRIEKDAEKELGLSYIFKAKQDSRICDLMVSGCDFQTKLLRESFWYKGEILEKGIPRSDIFFQKEKFQEIRARVCEKYGIPQTNSLVLYAPTFRRDRSLDPYSIDWKRALPELREHFNNPDVTVFLRLHPNMIHKDVTPLMTDPAIINATRYHDMQELLCAVDMLITDYSSSMFDMSMLNKTCILYATDIEQYNRGYYFKFNELPYPVATSNDELIEIIRNFDSASYIAAVKDFMDNKIGLFEDGNASKSIAEWIYGHRL